MKEVTTYYLEMKSASSLKTIDASRGPQILECKIKQFQFNKFLYQLVGKDWKWIDKLSWSEEQCKAYAENDNLRTWVAYI
jgi:hypothetical protein